MSYDTSIKRGALANAWVTLDRLRVDLHDTEGRLAKEHLKLATGWRQLDKTAEEAEVRAEAAITESRKEPPR